MQPAVDGDRFLARVRMDRFYPSKDLCGAGESHLAGTRIPDWQLPRHLALSFIDFTQRMSRHVSTREALFVKHRSSTTRSCTGIVIAR